MESHRVAAAQVRALGVVAATLFPGAALLPTLQAGMSARERDAWTAAWWKAVHAAATSGHNVGAPVHAAVHGVLRRAAATGLSRAAVAALEWRLVLAPLLPLTDTVAGDWPRVAAQLDAAWSTRAWSTAVAATTEASL